MGYVDWLFLEIVYPQIDGHFAWGKIREAYDKLNRRVFEVLCNLLRPA